jgi:hypothetical protein
VALIMAIDRLTRNESPRSVYNTPGFIFICLTEPAAIDEICIVATVSVRPPRRRGKRNRCEPQWVSMPRYGQSNRCKAQEPHTDQIRPAYLCAVQSIARLRSMNAVVHADDDEC